MAVDEVGEGHGLGAVRALAPRPTRRQKRSQASQRWRPR